LPAGQAERSTAWPLRQPGRLRSRWSDSRSATPASCRPQMGTTDVPGSTGVAMQHRVEAGFAPVLTSPLTGPRSSTWIPNASFRA